MLASFPHPSPLPEGEGMENTPARPLQGGIPPRDRAVDLGGTGGAG